MNPSPAPSPSTFGTMRWDQPLSILLHGYKLFALCLGVILLLAALYLLKAPRLYESTGTVQVEMQEQRAFHTADDEVTPDDLRSDDAMKTIEQNMQNYTLFVDVASDPVLSHDPRLLVGYHGEKNPVDIDGLAGWIRSNTTVSLRRGSRLIDISVTHAVPAMAQQLVQALINAFFVENAKTEALSHQTAASYLVAQSAQVKSGLQSSENSLQIYKDALLLKDQIEDQQRVVDALRQRYRDKHPLLIQARALLNDLQQTFDREFQHVINGNNSESSYWATNSAALKTESPADRIPTELKMVEARSNVLQMEVDTESALYDSVLKQMHEANVNGGAAATQVHLVEPPDLPTKLAKPRKLLILALAGLLGCVVGTVAVFLANAIDSSIKNVIEAEETLGVPALGLIPLYTGDDSGNRRGSRQAALRQKSDELVVRSAPASATAEGFRSLRAAMGLLGKSKDHRSVLFTSPLSDEGKSFVSSNYALAMAQTGQRTLLIDTDLRRPSVHTRFKLENSAGFVEMVTQGRALRDVVHPDVARNLDVLTAGARCPNPAELLSGDGFSEVLALAKKSYDRIVIDCSPVNLVSDSLLIASHVDSVCLIVRAGQTARRDAVHALSLLQRTGIALSGFVLNAVPPWNDRIYPHYLDKKGAKYREAYSQVYQH